MKTKNLFFLLGLSLILLGCNPEKVNILVIIGDDISRNSLGAYGCKYINTPNLDKLASEGIVFTNAFVCNPKCAPSRAGLLTGRYSWQLEEACNHNGVMPKKWKFYPGLLEQNGYFIGFTGKGWAPGHYHGEHNPAGWEYNDIRSAPPYPCISDKDYAANFEAFLDANTDDKPFCFWLGTHEAHRAFTRDSYKDSSINLNDIVVQDCFPDNETIRGDLADYGIEVEYHDHQAGLAIRALEERGLLNNTIIIATSDHGMAFPHIKGQIYDEGFRVPFIVHWGDKIKSHREVSDFINFPDVAPTLMEAAGLPPDEQMTGKSFLDILNSNQSGRIDKHRSVAVLGKERHDIGRTDGKLLTVGYPVRAIRNDTWLYVHNYIPNRWPAGNPEYGYKNCDDSPTRQYLLNLDKDHPDYPFYKMAFYFRPGNELYNIKKDPDCVVNLAEQDQYSSLITELKSQLDSILQVQKDPRIYGQGEIFDYYPHGRPDKLISLYGEKYYDMYAKFFEKYGYSSEEIPEDSLKINKEILRQYQQQQR